MATNIQQKRSNHPSASRYIVILRYYLLFIEFLRLIFNAQLRRYLKKKKKT